MGIIVQIDNNAILLDYGMSVANNSIPKWHPSLNFVNAVLLTHAHLDHSGALPYLITPENGILRFFNASMLFGAILWMYFHIVEAGYIVSLSDTLPAFLSPVVCRYFHSTICFIADLLYFNRGKTSSGSILNVLLHILHLHLCTFIFFIFLYLYTTYLE